jgi:hypothetical protein
VDQRTNATSSHAVTDSSDASCWLSDAADASTSADKSGFGKNV